MISIAMLTSHCEMKILRLSSGRLGPVSLSCMAILLVLPMYARWEKSTSSFDGPPCRACLHSAVMDMILVARSSRNASLYETGMAFRECLVIMRLYSVLLVEPREMLY